jgi:hypothetical protein
MEWLKREAEHNFRVWPPGAKVRCIQDPHYKLKLGEEYTVLDQPSRGIVVLKEFPGVWFTTHRFKRVVRVKAQTVPYEQMTLAQRIDDWCEVDDSLALKRAVAQRYLSCK